MGAQRVSFIFFRFQRIIITWNVKYKGKWMTNKNMINLVWNKSGEPVNHYGEIVKFKIFKNLLNIWGNPGNWKLFIAFELLMTSTWFTIYLPSFEFQQRSILLWIIWITFALKVILITASTISILRNDNSSSLAPNGPEKWGCRTKLRDLFSKIVVTRLLI